MGRRKGLGFNNKVDASVNGPARGLERVDMEVAAQMAGTSARANPESKRNKQIDEQLRKAMGG